MGFFRFILRQSNTSRELLGASVFVGAISGFASVALLALINFSLVSVGRGDVSTIAVAFIGLCLLVTVARISSQYFLAQLGQTTVKSLRISLSRRILSTPLQRLERLGPNRLLATLTDDIMAMTQAMVMLPAIAINLTIVLGCMVYLAWLNGPLFLLILGFVILGVITYRLPLMLGHRRFRIAREHQDDLFGHFRGLTDGIKELKLHRNRRGAFVGLIERTTEVLRRLRVGAAIIFGSAAAWGQLLFFIVIGLVVFARPSFVVADRATLISYTIVLLYMLTPLQVALNTLQEFSRANVAVSKVIKLGFDLAPDEESRPATVEAPAPSVWRKIELAGVTHSYHHEATEETFTLGPIDLTLEPGELVFVVGGNGSGKTTLAKLMIGLYRPEGGDVVLDGLSLDDETADDFRQLFSAVFDDFYLFETFLGLENPDLEPQARRYLEELKLQHKVKVEGASLSTTRLSKGQRKRLALLTAYLEDRPIYLFDEWAADQDPVFKEIFYRQILPDLKRRGKTAIVISHDDRYFNEADRLLKLEDGQIEFTGSFDEFRSRFSKVGSEPAPVA